VVDILMIDTNPGNEAVNVAEAMNAPRSRMVHMASKRKWISTMQMMAVACTAMVLWAVATILVVVVIEIMAEVVKVVDDTDETSLAQIDLLNHPPTLLLSLQNFPASSSKDRSSSFNISA